MGVMIRYVVGHYVLISPQTNQFSKADHSEISDERVQLDTYREDAQLGPSVHNTSTNDLGHIDSGTDGSETTEL